MRPEQGVRRERHWGKRPFAKEAADVFMLPAVGFHPVQTGGEGLFYVLLGDFFSFVAWRTEGRGEQAVSARCLDIRKYVFSEKYLYSENILI